MKAATKITIGKLRTIVNGITGNAGKLKLYKKTVGNISVLEGVISVSAVSIITSEINGVKRSQISPVTLSENLRSDIEIVTTVSGAVIGKVKAEKIDPIHITTEVTFVIPVER